MYQDVEQLVSTAVVDEYLGFEIRCLAHDLYCAVSKTWEANAIINGTSLWAVRKQVWMWWFRV